MPFKTHVKASVKDVDSKQGIIRVYGSAFGNEDSDGDIIDKGAYARTIADKEHRPRIKFLWQHDPWQPIGFPSELEEDDHGLLAVGKVSKTQQGRDALILYEDGVITEHSVRISNIRRSESDRRHIVETTLWEISPVTWGANPLTPLLDLKSGEADVATVHKRMLAQVHQAQQALKASGSAGDGISDELGYRIEALLELWETQLDALAKAAETEAANPAALLDELVKAATLDFGLGTPLHADGSISIETEEDALRAIIDRL